MRAAHRLARLSAAARVRCATSNAWTPEPNAVRFGTSDVCDVHHQTAVDDATSERSVVIAAANYFKDYGGRTRFWGRVSTVRCYENNPLVRAALNEKGANRVLVVDGGASTRCALSGDNLAEIAAANGWSGIIINGCVRDSEDVRKHDVGVKAIGTHPLKSAKRDPGVRDVPVTFANVTFHPGHYVYADADGVVVSMKKLDL